MARRRRHAILALLLGALLQACSAAVRRDPPPPSAALARRAPPPAYDDDYSSEAPFDPFDAWDYDGSEELEPQPQPKPAPKPKPTSRPGPKASPRPKATPAGRPKSKSTPRPKPKAPPRPKATTSAKVTVSAKLPKVTVKTKNSANRKNFLKTTTVDIESFTRFVITQKPMTSRKPPKSTTMSTTAVVEDEEPKSRQGAASRRPRPTGTTARPHPVGNQQKRTTTRRHDPSRVAGTRAPPASRKTNPESSSKKETSRPPPKTTRTTRAPQRSTRAPPRTTRAPAPPRTTRAPPRTTKAPARTTRRPPRTTRDPPRTTRQPARASTTRRTPAQKKTDQCPPKDAGWIASFFDANHKILVPSTVLEPAKPGILNKVYGWLGWSDSGTGSDEDSDTTWLPSWQLATTTATTTTTTTPPPPPTDEPNWFYSLLNSEEDDGAYAPLNNTDKNPKKPLRKRYNGFQLLRAYPEAAWKVHELLELQEETQGSGVLWWTTPSVNSSADILVPPDLLPDVKDHLNSLGLDYDVVIWDLQKAIMYENPKLSKKQRVELEQLRGHPLTWRRYHRYADMLRYLEYLQHSYPDLVDLVPLGRSSEGLPLVAVKVSFPSNETSAESHRSAGGGSGGGSKRWRLRSKMKPAVWLEAGAHAREWIAPAAATWMLHALVEGDRGIGTDYEMLKAADWYIAPLLNPDGYEHTHTHDRLWRKTRSQHTRADTYYNSWFPWNWGNTECVGVDADRNFDFHWGEKGASRDPCSEHYAGPHPFSEPETRAVSDFMLEHKERIKVYISLHAYSQMWLVPSTHSRVPFSDDGDVMEMGKLATAALGDLYGTKYQVGTTADLTQPTTGSSFEWAKGRAGIKYSYNVKLRDSHGPYGFLLPGSQIVPTAKETWTAIKTIVENL